MRRILFLIVFLTNYLSPALCRSQESKVDSLVVLAVSLSEDALFGARFKEAKSLIEFSSFQDLTGFSPRHKILLTIQNIRINDFMNVVYAQKENPIENFERLKKLLPLAQKLDDLAIQGHYFLAFSSASRSIGKPDSSAIYESKALSIFKEINNFEEIAKIRAGNISRYHIQLFQEGKKREILELIPTYKKEIKYSQIFSKYAQAYNTRHLAQIHRRQTFNYKEALRLFKISLDLRIEIGFKPFIPASYSSLGDVYMKMGEYSKAIDMYNKSSEFAEEIGFVRYQLYPNIQIGDIYQNKGQSEKAFDYYNKALKFATENDYLIGIDQSIEKIRKMNKK